ncbi:MAG: PKD domain-containing protein, partial [archaeon]
MKFKEGIGLIIFLFLMGFVSANFAVGNVSNSIPTQYSQFEKISGWTNISLIGEPTNSFFKDLENNTISLLDLIKKNEDFEYSCDILGCISNYETEGTSKKSIDFSLNSEQEKLIGFVLNGKISSITSLSFKIDSNAGPSCYSQIEIDLLKDGSIDFTNKKLPPVSSSCISLLSRGCFDSSKTSGLYSIGKFPSKHCQEIILPASPGFQIGAWINNQAEDARNLTIALYDLNIEQIKGANCTLPYVTGSRAVSCNVNHYVKEPTSYFVCIYSDKVGNSKIKGYYDKISGCGFYQESEMNPEKNAAFDLFVQGVGFGSVGEMNVSDSSEDMMSSIKDYIESRYGGNECPKEGCIIPILINSREKQEIHLNSLKVTYITTLGGTETEDIYILKEVPAKISSEFQKLFLDYGNFTVSSRIGNETFKLSLNDKEVFSKKVEIRSFPKISGLYPRNVPSMVPVNFFILANSSKNITSYTWDFNDSTPIQKTTINRTSHTYSVSKMYEVKVEIQDSEGLNASETFKVLVMIPKEQIESELEKKLKTLETIKSQIANFDETTQKGLNSILEIANLENELKNIQKEYGFAFEEEDYAKIIINLSLIEIPELVAMTKKAPSLPFYPMGNQIDLEVLKNVGGGTYPLERRKAYEDAVLGWQMSNAKITISMEEFSVMIKKEGRPILTRFVLNVEKNYSDKPVYLFIKKMKDLQFKERYFEKESENYFYWVLSESQKEIEFVTSEIINCEELPAFVSPEISSLSVTVGTDITPFIENLKAKWAIIS